MYDADKVAKKLAKSISKTKAFDNGTVISWTSHSTSTGINYKYVAVFANGNWYTSIRVDNRHLKSVMNNEEMMKYLGSNEGVRDIKVASEFVEVEL